TPVSTPTDAILFRLSQSMKRLAGFVLGGGGADELLCGYAVPHFSGHDFDRSLRLDTGDWSPAPHVGRMVRESLRRSYGRDRFASGADHYFALNSMIGTALKPHLLNPAIWDAAGRDEPMIEWCEARLGCSDERSASDRTARTLHRVILECLLSRLDSAALQAGLEVRPVFAGRRLVEQVFRLRERFKIGVADEGPASC